LAAYSTLHRRPPNSPPFPYTTLFRSQSNSISRRLDPANQSARPAAGRQDCWKERTKAVRAPSAVHARLSRQRNARRRTCDCASRSEEHTSELQSRENIVCRLLLEKKK